MTPVVLVVTVLKIVFLALPLSVASLAFRRLLLSQTANAWLYGSTMLFAVVTTLGMLPWVTGLAAPSGIFLLFSALSPMAWLAVVMLCGSRGYRIEIVEDSIEINAPGPLVLTEPVATVVPTFRHSRPETFGQIETAGKSPAPPPETPAPSRPGVQASLLRVALEMRGKEREGASKAPEAGPSAAEGEGIELPFLERPVPG